jgi:hypothetical protein
LASMPLTKVARTTALAQLVMKMSSNRRTST